MVTRTFRQENTTGALITDITQYPQFNLNLTANFADRERPYFIRKLTAAEAPQIKADGVKYYDANGNVVDSSTAGAKTYDKGVSVPIANTVTDPGGFCLFTFNRAFQAEMKHMDVYRYAGVVLADGTQVNAYRNISNYTGGSTSGDFQNTMYYIDYTTYKSQNLACFRIFEGGLGAWTLMANDSIRVELCIGAQTVNSVTL